ncbi:hypothetical protein [Acinetobacter larvae]|uniref:DNA-binding protein n=1 Tax=Acinetobacter larvae TaxID=1789224 RepID=A0A1B2LX97_9GAMM|nr:hypothetical protein [Acinetobacter larvae]AOA57560.1 hypothetical protein BFG52_03795 [Acinetobacter larvae]
MSAATIIPFTKPQTTSQEAKSMYSDRFKQGYVMSSRLYRNEVRPFLSDAAHNVYERLEEWINGQLKETDHVSHRQIQGGKLKGSNKLGSATVSNGIKELVWFGVITVTEKNNKIGNKYEINEISLAHYFEEFSASVIKALRISNESASISEALLKVKQSASVSDTEKPFSASVSDASIDSFLDIREEEEESAQEKFTAQENRQLNFIEYHPTDRTPISLKELFKKYPAQVDFIDQAKASFPDHSPEQIFAELKKLAQWSLSAANHMPQKWMSIWLNWMKKTPTAAELEKSAKRKSASTEKPQKQNQSRFGKYLKPQQGIRDV